jgi:hypothetical protein
MSENEERYTPEHVEVGGEQRVVVVYVGSRASTG